MLTSNLLIYGYYKHIMNLSLSKLWNTKYKETSCTTFLSSWRHHMQQVKSSKTRHPPYAHTDEYLEFAIFSHGFCGAVDLIEEVTVDPVCCFSPVTDWLSYFSRQYILEMLLYFLCKEIHVCVQFMVLWIFLYMLHSCTYVFKHLHEYSRV